MHSVVFHFSDYLTVWGVQPVVTQQTPWPVLMHCLVCSIPFFVAAPTTTLDPNLPAGSDITIEHRPGSEVTHFQGKQVAPDGIDVSSAPHCHCTCGNCFWRADTCQNNQFQGWNLIQTASLLQPANSCHTTGKHLLAGAYPTCIHLTWCHLCVLCLLT